MSSGIVGLIKVPSELSSKIRNDFREIKNRHWKWHDNNDHSLDEEFTDIGQGKINTLIDQIRNAFDPPIIYRSEWIDYWSMGNIVFEKLSLINVKYHAYDTNKYNFVISEDIKFNQVDVKKIKARLRVRKGCQESKWASDSLINCIESWSKIINDFSIISYRQCIGGLLEDGEMVRKSKDRLKFSLLD
jgi:hypothetical protein